MPTAGSARSVSTTAPSSGGRALSLGERAREIHQAQGFFARIFRTTSVLEVVDEAGETWYLVASSGKRPLSPGQLALLGAREIPAKSVGLHAEWNALAMA